MPATICIGFYNLLNQDVFVILPNVFSLETIANLIYPLNLNCFRNGRSSLGVPMAINESSCQSICFGISGCHFEISNLAVAGAKLSASLSIGPDRFLLFHSSDYYPSRSNFNPCRLVCYFIALVETGYVVDVTQCCASFRVLALGYDCCVLRVLAASRPTLNKSSGEHSEH